jgi:hypothetical protein
VGILSGAGKLQQPVALVLCMFAECIPAVFKLAGSNPESFQMDKVSSQHHDVE